MPSKSFDYTELELDIACLHKAVMRFMTSPNAPNYAQLIVNEIFNYIHEPLEMGYNPR